MSTSKDRDWCRFMRVSSEEEIRRHFDFVPDNQEFLIKLRSAEGATLVNFSYILKKGKPLPYSVQLVGKIFLLLRFSLV